MSKDDRGINFVTISEEEFVREAKGIVDYAKDRGITLRILGALAVYIHSMDKDECKDVIRRLGRFGEGQPMFTDLDLIGYSSQRKGIIKVFKEMNYKPFGMFNALFGDKRLIFQHPEKKFKVDVFLDKLEFSHDVDFSEPSNGRLELDHPTIVPADIVLEKLQIHEINRKDFVDLIVLFIGHDVSREAIIDTIDANRIASVLSNDWGFWYDAMNNLELVKKLANDLMQESKLSELQVKIICDRVNKLKEIVNGAKKSRDWEKRAKVGTSKRWYREVEELVR